MIKTNLEMVKTYREWLTAAILFCSLVFCACASDDDPIADTPVTPAPTPSAVDNGVWPVNESYVDNSVRPGDDFFMHRIGTWWANTTVNDNRLDPKMAGYITDVENWVDGIKPASPSAEKLKAHLENLDALSLQTASFLESTWIACGFVEACAEAETKGSTEPLWKCLGRMMAQGAAVPFDFNHISVGGKVCVVLSAKDSSFPYREPSGLRKLLKDADFLRSLVPLVGTGGTRAVDGSKWPQLVTMLNEAGIDPAYVYLPVDYPHISTMNESGKKELQEAQKMLTKYCDSDVKALAKLISTFGASEWEPLSSEKLFTAYKASFEENTGKTTSKDDFLEFYATNYVNYELSYLVGKKFVTDAFRQEGEEKCKAVINVFADRIRANTWLSEEGKRAALEKLNNININVGCPKNWIAEAIPDLSNSKSALEDAYLLRKAAFNFHKSLVGKPLKDVSFHLIISPDSDSPLSVFNAYYVTNLNSINIYPWWLMKPIYDPSYNQAVNYAIMTVVGHEITHGFDSEGYKFNKDGDPISIFTNPADEAKFVELGKKLAARFNELEVLPTEMPGEMSRGDFCLAENIADLGGFEIGFDAYTRYLQQHGFAGDELVKQQQRFFYAYTEQYRSKYGPNYVNLIHNGMPATIFTPEVKPDNHALNRERVNGIVRNVDSWYSLFNIKEGDKLYLAPANRVHIW